MTSKPIWIIKEESRLNAEEQKKLAQMLIDQTILEDIMIKQGLRIRELIAALEPLVTRATASEEKTFIFIKAKEVLQKAKEGAS